MKEFKKETGCVYRSSHQRCSIKKIYFAIFSGKHKKRLQHTCIPVNIEKFLRAAIFKQTAASIGRDS